MNERELFHPLPVGVYRCTPEGTLVDGDSVALSILGLSTLPGSSKLHDFFAHPGDAELLLDSIAREGKVVAWRAQMRRAGGDVFWGEHHASLEGRAVVVGMLEEVSAPPAADPPSDSIPAVTDELRRSAEALRESELRYRTLVERMNEGVLQVDNFDVIQFVNPRFCEMVGYRTEELTGKVAHELLMAPEDREWMKQKLVTRSRKISDKYEIQIVRKSGEKMWVQVSGAPVIDAGGAVIGSIGVHTDITDRRRAEAGLRASEQRYRLLFERNLAGVFRSTSGGRILDCNDAFARIFGFHSREEALTRRAVEFYEDPTDRQELLRKLRRDRSLMNYEIRMRRRDGELIWLLENVSLIEEEGEEPILEGTLIDITDRKRALELIHYQAFHDALTDLPNRLLFKDRLALALASAQRNRKQLAVMFLDLDHFKLINDTLGHSVGDQLLRAVAGRLRGCVRGDDTVARVGGDEFTLLLVELRSIEDTASIASKILKTISDPFSIEDHEIFVTTSVGIASYPHDGFDVETLMKNADGAMYRAKELGRNTYQLCTPAMTTRAMERLSLTNALRRAVDRQEFVVHYQPQFHLRTGHMIGVEALVRWQSPERGLVGAASFVPVAEESRLIVPIGEWVLRTACRQLKTWQCSGAPALRVAVNLSARQFQQHEISKVIEDALRQSGLSPSSLTVEITESTAMQNPELTGTILQELRSMGVGVALDDFGTGHSSLNYLKRFPIDTLKIDHSFVQDILSDKSNAAIVSAVIAMARALGMEVIAEGVETEEQLQFLKQHGCEQVQGYLFREPLPADQIDKALHFMSVDREP